MWISLTENYTNVISYQPPLRNTIPFNSLRVERMKKEMSDAFTLALIIRLIHLQADELLSRSTVRAHRRTEFGRSCSNQCHHSCENHPWTPFCLTNRSVLPLFLIVAEGEGN